MGKLTLQELSAYLPWGLEAKLSKIGIFNLDSEYPNEHKDKICTITDYGFMNGDFYGQMKVNDSKYSFDFDSLDEIDILLLPLSHLTKPINHKGEEFVPLERLFNVAYKSIYMHDFDGDFFRDESLNNILALKAKEDGYDYGFSIELPYHFRLSANGDFLTIPQFDLYKKLYEWHFAVNIHESLYIDKSSIQIL
jgi:hypothetical protein